MKIQEIRKIKAEEMGKRLSELRLELSKELGSVKMGRAVKNPGKIKEIRKSIARMETVKRELRSDAKTLTKSVPKTAPKAEQKDSQKKPAPKKKTDSKSKSKKQ